jgi:hypothetical protein
MSHHRRNVRPRYGRIGVLAASITISAVAALANFGVLPTSSAQAGTGPHPAAYSRTAQDQTPSGDSVSGSRSDSEAGGPSVDRSTPAGQDPSSGSSTQLPGSTDGATTPGTTPGATQGTTQGTSTKAVPADSGSGRRIVFSQSLQRVWLLGRQPGDVQKTYLVSGSVTHNLQPGTYSVYSKSRWAVGIDDSGVMQYFVRFTQGPTGAAIGFHSIPTKNGVALQTRAQLGTPQSHGCIRQYLPNAIALWDFAPIGTKVVVVA